MLGCVQSPTEECSVAMLIILIMQLVMLILIAVAYLVQKYSFHFMHNKLLAAWQKTEPINGRG